MSAEVRRTGATLGQSSRPHPATDDATIAIFLPIYFGVVLPGRWFLLHKDNPQVKGFVRGATAAAAGATVVLTQGAVTDLSTAAMALVTLGFLLRYKVKAPYVVLACAALGIALH